MRSSEEQVTYIDNPSIRELYYDLQIQLRGCLDPSPRTVLEKDFVTLQHAAGRKSQIRRAQATAAHELLLDCTD